MTPSGLLSIGTGRDNADGAIERRVIHINGKAQRNQQCLAEHIAMTWVTPDMDRILADGASARRNLIDRLAYSFDPSHKGRITRYEKAMRDRLHLIRENRVDAAWLNALEDEMAQTSTAIAATRLHMVQELQTAHSLAQSSFPRAELALIGLAEETITNQPALLVEDLLRATLRQNRDADRDAGMTTVGVHRTDLAVLHTGKNCPARFCSTGEQKALLISIILAFLRILGAARGMNPLLLLDDIAAHLDEARRRALFDEITDQGVQVWANGTDDDDYNFMHNRAQFIYVSGGRLI
jgi:DNA replication and repair protein RecF